MPPYPALPAIILSLSINPDPHTRRPLCHDHLHLRHQTSQTHPRTLRPPRATGILPDPPRAALNISDSPCPRGRRPVFGPALLRPFICVRSALAVYRGHDRREGSVAGGPLRSTISRATQTTLSSLSAVSGLSGTFSCLCVVCLRSPIPRCLRGVHVRSLYSRVWSEFRQGSRSPAHSNPLG